MSIVFPVYFSHGYREREIVFNEYFGILFEKSGLRPSIDPPSDDVNAAKLEKHLNYTNGLVAVISKRKNLVSPFILFEINMCLKLGKPALVFVEDNLPEEIVPKHILQKRYSTKSFSRQVFEHMHSIEIFKKFLGASPIPKYQVASKQKSCLILGAHCINQNLVDEINTLLNEKGYRIISASNNDELPLNNLCHFELLNLDLAIVFENNSDPILNYYYGAINSYQIPSILFTTEKQYAYSDDLPLEFQPKFISNSNSGDDLNTVIHHIELFEEDFVVLEDKDKIYAYVESLASSFSVKGEYSRDLRTQIINNIVGGDNFSNISDSKIINRSSNNSESDDKKTED